MSTDFQDENLSQIETKWSQILKAIAGDHSDTSTARAQQNILDRYGSPIRNYLLAATRDESAAEDLAQEFAFRFVRGDLKNVSPERGRFRDYLKAVLRNSVNDFFRKRQKERINRLDAFSVEIRQTLDDSFNEDWRQELIQRTWQKLEQYSRDANNLYFAVLSVRAKFPDLNSHQLAEKFTTDFGHEYNSAWVRQNLKRARSKFCECLLAEVANTLSEDATKDEIESELADLRLLKYTEVN